MESLKVLKVYGICGVKKPKPKLGDMFYGYADLEGWSDPKYLIIDTNLGGLKLSTYSKDLGDLYKVEVKVVKLSRNRKNEQKPS